MGLPVAVVGPRRRGVRCIDARVCARVFVHHLNSFITQVQPPLSPTCIKRQQAAELSCRRSEFLLDYTRRLTAHECEQGRGNRECVCGQGDYSAMSVAECVGQIKRKKTLVSGKYTLCLCSLTHDTQPTVLTCASTYCTVTYVYLCTLPALELCAVLATSTLVRFPVRHAPTAATAAATASARGVNSLPINRTRRRVHRRRRRRPTAPPATSLTALIVHAIPGG